MPSFVPLRPLIRSATGALARNPFRALLQIPARIPARILAPILGLALLLAAAPARAIETPAREAIVVDYNTGTVLMEKDADRPVPPASMSKLMTLYLTFEALRDGRLTLDERLPVSEKAMSYKGSTMFLTTRDKVRVEDLIKGVIVLSGNDATTVLAEAIAGSEAQFAVLMNRRARQLGLTGSTFANSNGWPDPRQRMSARDLATLAIRLIRDFPEYYPYFALREFDFDGRAPANRNNRNPLLYMDIGADGLKTGHTSEAGYGLVGSAVRGGRRVIVVVMGLETSQARAQESAKLINWAFRQFVEKKIVKKGQVLASAPVWLGTQDRVALEAAADLTALLPVTQKGPLEGTVTMTGPVPAPIRKGQELGLLTLRRDNLPPLSVPLVAAADVPEAGFASRFRLAAGILAGRLQEMLR